jgi:transcriptional regulator GlxA family with amidase domain
LTDADYPMTMTGSSTEIAKTERIQFVLLPRFNMATLATMIEPLRIANYIASSHLYTWSFTTPSGGTVQASNGIPIYCTDLDTDEGISSSIILLGSWGAERYSDERLISWLRNHTRHGRAMIGVEIGVYIFARAGLLTNRKATTHWSLFAGFAETFPQVHAIEQMFTIDGNIMTCAGGMAGIDLMLQRIAGTHDDDLSNEVARQMLHHFRGQDSMPQRPSRTAATIDVHPVIKKVTQFLEDQIEDNITIPELCEHIGIPQRKLERLFNRYVGCTVVQFYRLLRLQYARTLLVSTNMDIREISVASGFNSMSYFSHCFTKTFGRKPSLYRLAWPEEETVPSWPGTIYDFTHSDKFRKPETRRKKQLQESPHNAD